MANLPSGVTTTKSSAFILVGSPTMSCIPPFMKRLGRQHLVLLALQHPKRHLLAQIAGLLVLVARQPVP
ncbi:hypothetical protein ACRAWF_25695 [Streptomyces sp. L7]